MKKARRWKLESDREQTGIDNQPGERLEGADLNTIKVRNNEMVASQHELVQWVCKRHNLL